eukprot:285353_1
MGNQHNAIPSKSGHNGNQNIKYSKLSKMCQKIYHRHGHHVEKRVVFISLIGLYRSWKFKNIPPLTMNDCLLLVPMKQIWIYQPSKYENELRTSFMSQITMFSDTAETEEFFEMIKWKDQQGLVCWIKDYFTSDEFPMYSSKKDCYPNHSDINPLISSFWYFLSTKLTTLHDPCTGNKYKPLILDSKWYKNKYRFQSKYDVKSPAILTELYFLTMKYKTTQEIIYQSNPNLNPVISYGNNTKNIMKQTTNIGIVDLFEDNQIDIVNGNNQNDIWFISEDYDPYDI